MKNTKPNKIAILSLALGLVLTGCGNQGETGGEQLPAIPVSLAQAGSLEQAFQAVGSGEVLARDRANLGTRIMGQVERLHVHLGQRVGKGELLVSINAMDLRARMAQAEASIAEARAAYENAQRDLERFQGLFQKNSASQKELDDYNANFQMAKARLDAAGQMRAEAASQLPYTEIRAPFEGHITNIHMEEGDLANPGLPLISMESNEGFEVHARVSENQINGISVGSRARVHLKALDTTVSGTLTALSPSGLTTGGQYSIELGLDQVPAGIRSGMYVSVSLKGEGPVSGENRVSIPLKALVRKGQLSGVYTLGAEQVALLRWLRLGQVHGEEVEVLSGLARGEQYIIEAQGKLHNGAKVSIQ